MNNDDIEDKDKRAIFYPERKIRSWWNRLMDSDLQPVKNHEKKNDWRHDRKRAPKKGKSLCKDDGWVWVVFFLQMRGHRRWFCREIPFSMIVFIFEFECFF